MKVVVIALVSLMACVILMVGGGSGGHVGAQSVAPRLGKATFGWSAAKDPAIMKQGEAIAAAKNVFDGSLFTHPFTTEYGSIYVGRQVQDAVTGEWRTVGPRDVWKITISGLNLPTPGGRRPGANAPVLYAHTLVIYVDDKTGKYLQATSF